MITPGMAVAGRYRIVAEAGSGGSGSVFLADDMHLPGRTCAVKIVHERPGEPGAVALDEVAREARVLVTLDHPAVPRVTDVVVDGDRACLVMDFVPGRDLAAVSTDAWRHGRRLDTTTVADWADDLLDAVAYLHRHAPPVIHGDIKPSNIKLTPDGQLRLVDFGLAVQRHDTQGTATLTLARGGSPPYQSLEQASGGRLDARSDLYSIGATLFHLLTGHAPVSAAERFVGTDPELRVQSYRHDVPDGLAHAVDAALALHPDQRPPSAEAMAALLHGAGVPRTSASGWQSGLRANWWLVMLVLVLLFAAAAISVAP
jgi:serine/threonine-protein kinase